MQNCLNKLKKNNSVDSRAVLGYACLHHPLQDSTELFLYFGRVLHLRDIHYGIIGFVGIVLGLVYFLIENLCSTLGIHCLLLEIIENHR